MATFRMSIFWQTVDAEGWSDNFFWSGADIASAQIELDSLINRTKQLRNGDCSIIYARVSDVAIRGDSLPPTLTMPVFEIGRAHV